MRVTTVRDGLGYRYDAPGAGVSMRLDRLRESSGEVSGELVISRAPDGHLLVARVNLLSATTRAALAKQVGSRSNSFDWTTALERFFLETIALEREGEPWVAVGRLPARQAPPYLMRPFLYESKPSILYGAGGLGKSTIIASAIAVALVSGRAPLASWSVMRTGPVMVLDWEGDPDDWNDSISAIAAGLGIEPPELDYRTCRGPLESQIHSIAERAQATGAVCVIVDSAEAAMRSPRESGSDDPAKRFYDALRLIPSAALVIDHVTKAQAEHGGNGGPIGNVTKSNRARATFELKSAGKDSEDGTRHLIIVNRKNNLDRAGASEAVAVVREPGIIRIWHEELPTVTARELDARMPLWERVRRLLDGHEPMSAPEIVGALGLSTKDPVRSVEIAMQRHKDVFDHAPGHRLTRAWYVIEGASDLPSTGQIIAFPGTTLEEPTGSADDTSDGEPGTSRNVREHVPEHEQAPWPDEPGGSANDTSEPDGPESLLGTPDVTIGTSRNVREHVPGLAEGDHIGGEENLMSTLSARSRERVDGESVFARDGLDVFGDLM